jgi:protein O-GlcNAc transferase
MSLELPKDQQQAANALMARAKSLMNQGMLDGADALFGFAVSEPSVLAEAMHYRGIIAMSKGLNEKAKQFLGISLAADPNSPAPHTNMGTILLQEEKLDVALAAYEAALTLDPAQPLALIGSAKVYERLGLFELARTAYELARAAIGVNEELSADIARLDGLASEPTGAASDAASPYLLHAMMNAGNRSLAAGHAERARAYFQSILLLAPTHAQALHALGAMELAAGDLDAAERHLDDALNAMQGLIAAHVTLSEVLLARGDKDGATKRLEHALRLAPGDASLHATYAATLNSLGRIDDSIAHFEQALRLDPQQPAEVFETLGQALLSQDRLDNAEVCLTHAAALNPHSPGIFCALADLASRNGAVAKARDYLEKAFALNPDFPSAHLSLANIESTEGDAKAAIASYRRAIGYKGAPLETFSNLLLVQQYDHEATQQQLFADTVEIVGPIERDWPRLPAEAVDRNPDKLLRIGFVSQDFCQHSVGYFLTSVFRHHDKRRFELFAYSSRGKTDHYTRFFQGQSEFWRSTVNLSKQAIAEQIREDGIDILVDLGGHTNPNVFLFAARPAPVQVSWLGFPDTTGLASMDYRLTDDLADPQTDERYTTETLWRLPQGFHCYAPLEELPAVSSLPALENGFVTFGCFNNFAKLNPLVFAAWSDILNALPSARLVLKSRHFTDAGIRAKCLENFARHGIGETRLELLELMSMKEHFLQYNRIDIALDTFPYNGTTTTCEAIAMGAPVVSMKGSRHAARVGESLLTQLGLEDLVSADPKAYAQTAIGLAGDLPRLAEMRAGLRSRLLSSSLSDGVGFTRRLETAFAAMWARHCSQAT